MEGNPQNIALADSGWWGYALQHFFFFFIVANTRNIKCTIFTIKYTYSVVQPSPRSNSITFSSPQVETLCLWSIHSQFPPPTGPWKPPICFLSLYTCYFKKMYICFTFSEFLLMSVCFDMRNKAETKNNKGCLERGTSKLYWVSPKLCVRGSEAVEFILWQ